MSDNKRGSPVAMVAARSSSPEIDMTAETILLAHLTRVIIEQLAPVTEKIEELRTSLALLGQRVDTIGKLEAERKELEIRVRDLENRLNHLYGAGGVAGVGGKWLAGILGSVIGALFVAAVVAIVSKVMMR